MEPTMASWLRILTTVATGRVRREKRKSTTSLLASPYSTRPPLVSTSSFMLNVEALASEVVEAMAREQVVSLRLLFFELQSVLLQLHEG